MEYIFRLYDHHNEKSPCPNQGKDRIVSWLLFKMKKINKALQDGRL
jgi:hypothetical protein